VANGTVALEVGLRTLGVGPGDEVIVPSRTFIASASAIVAVGARPVFADVDAESQNISVASIRGAITPATRAILAVHLGGWPCDMPAILSLAREHGLRVVEDCAQAQGATLHGRPVGSFGDVAAFSFCQDKIITTAGEGGMVCTADEQLWKKMWAYRDHGKDFEAVHGERESAGFRWVHESFGSNLRMTEVQSAVGRVALRKLPVWLERRRDNASYLAERLGGIAALRVPAVPAHVGHAYYRFYAFLCGEMLKTEYSRDRILEEIAALGVPCGSGSCSEVYLEKAFPAAWRPAQRLSVARELGETSLALLVHPTLERQHLERICEVVESVLRRATGQRSVFALQVAASGASAAPAMNSKELPGRDRMTEKPAWEPTGLRGRVVMVTGAAGSIGSELCAQILRSKPAKIVCLDWAETPLFELQMKLQPGAKAEMAFVVADMTDGESMRHHLLEHGVDAIFHAAAYKHVPLCEANPCEALKNNVFGLMDLLECAEECGCEDFLLISTDKAVNPGGVMGCTKRLGEMMLGSKPFARMRCVSVRFGNVVGSQGSVVPIFQEQIRSGLPVTVTHAEMTRYFMTISEARYLVLQAFSVGDHGEILVLDMGEPVRIVDLAKTLMRAGGKSEGEIEIQYIGVRPGEKLHEELFYVSETPEPTSVPQVQRAKGKMARWPELLRELSELRECSLSRNENGIRSKLKEIIPEYSWDGAREGNYSAQTVTWTGVGL
jgi:dTDP-4-amino-4,6-dideoxygalactose transaminase/nucleoside-diphosphate-sugar epimerase